MTFKAQGFKSRAMELSDTTKPDTPDIFMLSLYGTSGVDGAPLTKNGNRALVKDANGDEKVVPDPDVSSFEVVSIDVPSAPPVASSVVPSVVLSVAQMAQGIAVGVWGVFW